jgi:hypothetical protein
MERKYYCLESEHHDELVSMYGDEISIIAKGPVSFFFYLTNGQLEELNAIGIFPLRVI